VEIKPKKTQEEKMQEIIEQFSLCRDEKGPVATLTVLRGAEDGDYQRHRLTRTEQSTPTSRRVPVRRSYTIVFGN
jgi:hypothetical protein